MYYASDDIEPITKARRFQPTIPITAHAYEAFKYLTSIKDDPASIYQFIQQANDNICKITGPYAAHLLNTCGYSAYALDVLRKIGVNSDSTDLTADTAILLVQTMTDIGTEDMIRKAYTVADTAVKKGTRKRVIELLLNCMYRLHHWHAASELIHTYFIGQPFMAEASDLVPLLQAGVDPEVRVNIFSLFVGQEIYLPVGEREVNSGLPFVPPSETLERFPMDLTGVLDTIKMRLPLASTSMPVLPELPDIKYVIDGANVLYSGGAQLLNKLTTELSQHGKVAVVLHIRHFKGKSGLSAHVNELERLWMLTHSSSNGVSLIKTPYGVNDDYYSIWVAMTRGAYLVTNDQFRDHVYKISPLIARWKKNYVIKFNLTGALQEPIPFSHCIQWQNEQFWLPTEDPAKWVCVSSSLSS